MLSPDSVTVSAIISTYNNPGFLELCLLGFMRQSYKNFEIIIADDGSHTFSNEENMLEKSNPLSARIITQHEAVHFSGMHKHLASSSSPRFRG
jgi:GT2 family glycosyltransferase